MPDIFEYYNHRKYLRDMYEAFKKRNKSFSYRYISQKCNFASSSFFKKVIDGENSLNMNTILALSDLFKLTQKDKEYFEYLVLFNQAQTHQEKKYYLEKITAIKKIKVKTIDPFQYEFFTNWHNIAILELIDFVPFNGDFKSLAAMVNPPVKPTQAKKSIALLVKLNLIEKRDDGFYQKTNATLTTGYEAASTAIQNFQIAGMKLGIEAIDRFKKDDREIATLSLSISEDMMKRIKSKLKRVRREILEMARLDDRAERVYQVNMQVFPLSRVYDREVEK